MTLQVVPQDENQFWSSLGQTNKDMVDLKKQIVKGLTMQERYKYYFLNSSSKRYIDYCIKDYATKNEDGLHLDVKEVPKNVRENIMDYLFENDELFEEIICSHLQDLIDYRIPEIESERVSP